MFLIIVWQRKLMDSYRGMTVPREIFEWILTGEKAVDGTLRGVDMRRNGTRRSVLKQTASHTQATTANHIHAIIY